ncbi:MAG: Ig-like domain-containing protein, partial [Stenotrophomonas sp.]
MQKGGLLYQARQTIWNAPPDHPAGRHYYDNLGRCDDGAPAANQPPQVRLTSPSAGSTFSDGSTIIFSAAATDSDGSIRKVEFFRNGNSVGSVGSAPYSLAWHNAAAGNYLLSATATDDRNASTTSATVSVTVTAADKDSTAPSIPGGLSVR